MLLSLYCPSLPLPYLTFIPIVNVRITALNPATHSKRPVGLLSALQHIGMLHCFKLMESYLSSIFRRPSMFYVGIQLTSLAAWVVHNKWINTIFDWLRHPGHLHHCLQPFLEFGPTETSWSRLGILSLCNEQQQTQFWFIKNVQTDTWSTFCISILM